MDDDDRSIRSVRWRYRRQDDRHMILRFEESVLIHRPPAEVFRYVSDFDRAKEWRVGVRESSQTPPGPMVEGSRLHEETVVMGRRVVTEAVVDGFEPDRRFTFRHISGPIPVGGEYRVEAVPGGTKLTYRLDAELRGPWRLASPYLRRAGARMMAGSLEQLRERLT